MAADTAALDDDLQLSPMDDTHFFADAELPFHVWVRVPRDGAAFSWVLREAPRRGPPNDALSAAVTPACGARPRPR